MPCEKTPIVFYSNDHRQDLKQILCLSLKKAHESIFLSSFGLTDPHVLKILQAKSIKHLPISVLCKPKAEKSIKQKLGTSIQTIPCKGSGLLHEKILIIDHSLTFLGSTNLTPTSLTMHDNLVIGFYSKELSELISPRANFSLPLADQNISLFFLPEKEEFALAEICKLLAEAKKEIKIALFTFTHPKMLAACKKAKENGAKITVILDQFSAKGSAQKTVQFLQKENIAIRKSTQRKLMHHKWALIDNQIFITGSANWTKAAFSKNHDYLLIFQFINNKQLKFINKIWDKLVKESLQIVI